MIRIRCTGNSEEEKNLSGRGAAARNRGVAASKKRNEKTTAHSTGGKIEQPTQNVATLDKLRTGEIVRRERRGIIQERGGEVFSRGSGCT